MLLCECWLHCCIYRLMRQKDLDAFGVGSGCLPILGAMFYPVRASSSTSLLSSEEHYESTVDFLFPDRAHYIVQNIPSAARSHHGTAKTVASAYSQRNLFREGTTTTPDYFEKTI